MNKAKFNYIAWLLYSYSSLPARIKGREEMLLHPFVEDVDTNVGGGKSNVMGNQAETTAIMIAGDSELESLRNTIKVINKLLRSSRVEVRIIIEEMYIKPSHATITQVAPKVFLSESQVKRLRTEFFEELAQELAII